MPRGEKEAAKTHCPQGHAYDAANTRISNGMLRFCRACESARGKAKRRAGGKVIVLHADKLACPAGHPYDEQNTYDQARDGGRRCRTCNRAKAKARLAAHPELQMWRSARVRALRDNLPFAIDVTDIIIPPRCPVLGVALVRNVGRLADNSPSLDRIVPAKGYVKGNIAVISFKANRMKSNATLDELESVVMWLRAALVGAR